MVILSMTTSSDDDIIISPPRLKKKEYSFFCPTSTVYAPSSPQEAVMTEMSESELSDEASITILMPYSSLMPINITFESGPIIR